MKTRKRFQSWLTERSDRVMAWLTQPASTFSMDAFHLLRVDIKQIRTLLEFAHRVDPDFPYRKHFKTFRPLFQKAGHIRELQLQIQSVRELGDPTLLQPYTHKLYQKVEKEITALMTLLTTAWQNDIRKGIRKITPHFDAISKRRLKRRITPVKKNIRKKLRSDTLRKADIHAMRIQIKKMYYLQKLFGKDAPHHQTTDQFQDLLGRWHDQRVIGAACDRDIQSWKHNKKVCDALRHVQKEIRTREKTLFDQIMQERKSFLRILEET